MGESDPALLDPIPPPVAEAVLGPGARAFVRRVSGTLLTRVAGVVIGIVTLSVTTRLLGPSGRGEFAVTMAALALTLQFGNCGLHASATYWLSRDPRQKDVIGSLLFWFSIAAPLALSGVVVALLAYAPSLIGAVPIRLVLIALTAAPAMMFLLLAGNALLGLGRTSWFNLLDLGGKIAGLVAVVALYWTGLPALFAVYATLQYALAMAAYARLVGRRWPQRVSVQRMMPLFGYASRVFLAGLLMFLVLRSDLFLVNAMLGTASAGQYSVAVQVAEILSLVTARIAAILFPSLSAMTAESRWRSTRRALRGTAVLLAVMALLLAAIARPLFLAWFGPAFLPAVAALWWLLPGLCCLGLNSVLHQHLAASGMPWFLVWSTGVGVVLNVLLNIAMLPRFGITGAAMASTIAYGLLLVATTIFLHAPAGYRYRT